MDYFTLPQPLTSIEEPEDVPEPIRHSLYETFQLVLTQENVEGKLERVVLHD